MYQEARPPGYIQVPRNYGNQPPPLSEFNGSWQYTDPMTQQSQRLNDGATSRGTMVSSSRNFSGEFVESRSKKTNEQYHYHQYGQHPQSAEVHPPTAKDHTVPVLLCHTCSICSRMRSVGYHRNNPVVPGKPLVLSSCRKCKKRVKSQRRSASSYTRVRSCTADEPCDWPSEPVLIDIDQYEHRGRRRSREDVYVYRHSPSRPRVIRRSSSQTRLGLRVLQDHPPRVQVSSLSPRRASRYDEIWPAPDVVYMRAPKSDLLPSAHRTNPKITSRDEVWPPPDVVRTHSYRKAASPSRRPSSRIVELSPSLSPVRTRSARVVYRSSSIERRSRSVSPVPISFRDERRSQKAEARMMSHPRPYRPVLPDHHNFRRASDETSSYDDYMSRRRQESPSRGILKPPGPERETSRRRASMRESQQSTKVEIGGPRVHFGTERREERIPVVTNKERSRDAGNSSDGYEQYHKYSRHRYVEDPPLTPPVERMERLRVRQSPPSPQQSYEEEIRIDRARRISPSPPSHHEEIHVRHVSPLPPRERERTARPLPPASASPDRPAYSGYRHVSRARALSRTRSITPPHVQKPASDDVTDSDSAHSGEITEVRTWKGIDENGQPATFVEEKTMRMLEQGSDRGGHSEFRPLNERLGSRSWRNV
jgi:hypothetical protein